LRRNLNRNMMRKMKLMMSLMRKPKKERRVMKIMRNCPENSQEKIFTNKTMMKRSMRVNKGKRLLMNREMARRSTAMPLPNSNSKTTNP
jgi:hypothetical protein